MKPIIIALLVAANGFVFANAPEALFQQANQAYQANDFTKSIELYEQVLSAGYRSPELEYNLANAYFRTGQRGKAILHYERAKLLSPDDADIGYNLSLVREQMEKMESLPEFFMVRWWKHLRMLLPSNLWGALALVLFWAGAGGLCLWLFGKTRGQKKTGFFVGITLVLLSILPLALALDRVSYEKSSHEAIVLAPAASLKSAPDSAGSEVYKLQEGEKVELLDLLSGWWQVQLPNGEKGWINGSDLEEI